MVPRTHREDSEPVLTVSAIGTADANGDYLQHEAVAPHKPYATDVDPLTVVIRRDSEPHTGRLADAELADAVSTSEEITSPTKSRLSRPGSGLFRALVFIEAHQMIALTFALGMVLLLLAAVLALR